MVDLIAIGITVAFAALGWRRGLFAALLSFGGFLIAYFAAYRFSGVVGASMTGQSAGAVQGMATQVVSGVSVFVVVNIVVSLIGKFVRASRAANRREGWTPPLWDSLGGCAVGAAWGGAIMLASVWGLSVVHAATGKGPDVSGARLAGIASDAIGKAVFMVAEHQTGSSDIAQALSGAAANPEQTKQMMQSLLTNPALQQMLANPETMKALQEGVPPSGAEGAPPNPMMQKLADDPKMMRDLQAALSTGQLKMPEPGTAPVADDQLAQQAASDPKFMEMMKQMLSSMTSPPAAKAPAQGASAAKATPPAAATSPRTVMYKCIQGDSTVHYTNVPVSGADCSEI